MKNIILLIVSLLSFQSLFAQDTWLEKTKIADSLSLNKHKDVLKYRDSAIVLAKSESKKIRKMLLLFKQFSETELQLEKSKVKSIEYNKLKIILQNIDSLEINKKLRFNRNRNLYIYAFNLFYNFKDSEKYANISIDCLESEKVIDTAELFNAYYYNAINKSQLNKLSDASKCFTKSINLWTNYSKNDQNFLASIYLDYSNLYHKRFLNIPSKQIQLLNKASKIFTKIEKPDKLRHSFVYTNLGDLELERGNYTKALGYYNKNHAIFNSSLEGKSINRTFTNKNLKRTDIKKEVEYYKFLTDIYSNSNQEKELEKTITTLNKLKQKHSKNLSEVEFSLLSAANLNAGIYFIDKDTNKAKEFLNTGFALNPEKTIHKHNAVYFLAYGNLAKKEKNYTKAISFYKKAIETQNVEFSIKTKAFKQSAVVYLKLNDTTKAFNYINKTINIIAKNSTQLNIKTINIKNYKPSGSVVDAKHFVDLAKALKDTKNYYAKEIINLYQLALIHFEENFEENLISPKLNKLYQDINQGVYGALFKVKNKELFHSNLSSFENIESKLLLNSFFQNRMISGNDSINAIVSKEQEFRRTITYLKKKLLKKETAEIKQLLFEEQEKLKTLLVTATNTSKFPVFNLGEFLTLNKKSILKYKKIENDLFIMAFVNSKFRITKINDFNTIKKKIELFNTLLTNSNSSINNINKIGEELFNLLIPKGFKINENITIIPDDILHYLPFELLNYKNKYLLKNSFINYNSSLSFLNTQIKNSTNSNKVALFSPKYNLDSNEKALAVRGEAYNLKGAIAEVNAISKIVKNNELFLLENATKSNFIQLKNQYRILHLAMHSVLNDEDPELSTLLFSNNEELHISELYGLNLNADLAVLSACNTGVGKLKDGKGIVSINNAFTYAGVSNTIASLWSAPDQSTKEIMVDFYKNLKQKQPISLALRNAKLNYLKNADDAQLKHPFYWAGFVPYGKDKVIDLNNNSFTLVRWIGLLLVLIFGFLLFKRKSRL